VGVINRILAATPRTSSRREGRDKKEQLIIHQKGKKAVYQKKKAEEAETMAALKKTLCQKWREIRRTGLP